MSSPRHEPEPQQETDAATAAQVTVTPIAAPSILGLYGFAASTLMVAANLAGWYGNEAATPLIVAPFAFAFGGIAQFLAAMWAYRARDALATGIHGAWGSFWIGYGLYQLLIAVGVLPSTSASPVAASAFGFWFIGLAAITWVGVAAALVENVALLLVLGTLAIGSTLLAIGLIASVSLLETIAALVLVLSAIMAWYTASAMLLAATYRRSVLPVGPLGGRRASQPRLSAEPGVQHGQ